MKKYASLFIILSLLCLCFSARAQQVPVDEEDVYFILMGQADEAIKDEKYEDAAARLIEAMGVRPDSPTNVLLMSNLGMVYSMMDKDSLALSTLDRALEIAPQMVTVLFNRAKIKLKTGADRSAYDDFSRVIELDSLNKQARYYHGMMSLYGGKSDLALADFSVLEQLAPDDIETLTGLATYYALTRNDTEAIKYYKRLIEVDPAPEYFASLAGCYLATGQLPEASEILSKAFKRYSNDPELYYYRAWLNRDRYLLDEARADGNMAIKLGADEKKVKSLLEKRPNSGV